MSSETRNCQNCKKSFVVEPEDFGFYEKMQVPPPTWCPECRMVRRFAFSNVFSLYKRTCAKCRKGMITIHAPEKERIVYCMPCWWADDWDGLEYGMDYDSSRPFLDQVKELMRKTPWQTLEASYLTNVNTDYANALGHCKDCYLIFWADYCERAYYSTFLNGLKDSLDCHRMNESELCYESIGCSKCYRVFFSEECESSTDVWFSRSLSGCTNCLGCINLRNKSYCIFNEQYSKEEYFKKLAEMKLDSRAALDQLRTKVYEFWNTHPRRAYIGSSLNVNVTGDYVFESKNAHDVFMGVGVEDSRFVQMVTVAPARDCYDYSGWGNNAVRMYETAVVGEGSSDVKFSVECWPDALDNEYSNYAIASKHVFGCVNLKRKSYCILNKQYSKEEYEKLVAQIKKDMVVHPYVDARGRRWPYGEFFPLELSCYAYNESVAQQFFPKTKEQALAEGFPWYDVEPSSHTATVAGADLPDTIAQTTDAVLQETVVCAECGKAFRIAPGELALMRRLALPLPSRCFVCRRTARLARNNPPRLYERTCAKCGKGMKTSYAPDRPEIVYCGQCYQAEVA